MLIMQTSVLIYEDNKELRESIAQLIDYSIPYVLLDSFPNVTQVEKQVKELKPDIILMDIDMPGGVNGIDAVKKIRAFNTNTHIIMLTVFDDNRNVMDALCAGASGYLLKKHLSTRLTDAMQEVLTGGAPMSPAIARMVIASMQKKSHQEEDKYQLTPREKELITALSEGSSYKMIAANLFISVDTVRSHIKNIYVKMQAHTQLEAVAKAREAGII